MQPFLLEMTPHPPPFQSFLSRNSSILRSGGFPNQQPVSLAPKMVRRHQGRFWFGVVPNNFHRVSLWHKIVPCLKRQMCRQCGFQFGAIWSTAQFGACSLLITQVCQVVPCHGALNQTWFDFGPIGAGLENGWPKVEKADKSGWVGHLGGTRANAPARSLAAAGVTREWRTWGAAGCK